jgi:hypothetical protein
MGKNPAYDTDTEDGRLLIESDSTERRSLSRPSA